MQIIGMLGVKFTDKRLCSGSSSWGVALWTCDAGRGKKGDKFVGSSYRWLRFPRGEHQQQKKIGLARLRWRSIGCGTGDTN